MKLFYPKKNQIICLREEASKGFWDDHWDLDEEDIQEIKKIGETFISKITSRYIKDKDKLILEGGSGIGANVSSLTNIGYRCIGVDFAEKTVEKLNIHAPKLDIRVDDVRDLDFVNDKFFGYWSIGVIEHFWDGYKNIALEMKRVLEDGGYLFVSFPYLSPLRRVKVLFNRYKKYEGSQKPKDFYQYIMNAKSVVREFEAIGFDLIKRIPFDGIKGTKDEIRFLERILQKVYDYNGDRRLYVTIKKIIDSVLSLFGSHCVLLVFRNAG